jgi:beta-N-acetylhexosaminidase
MRHVRLVGLGLAALALLAAGTVVAVRLAGGSAGRREPHALPASTPASPPARPSPSASPSASPSPRGRAEVLAGCASDAVAAMDTAHRVGQVLMIGTPVNQPLGLTSTVSRYHLGGVFLAGRSQRSAADLRHDIDVLTRAVDQPPLVAVDQEGGAVQTLQGGDFPAVPSALRQGSWTASRLRAGTTAWAKRLADTGISLDLAPVADTVPSAMGTANPPIGAFSRQYGSDPQAVAADVATVVSAAQAAGVLTTLKHFPGLGRVRANTDTSTAAVDATTSPTDPYLAPFAAGIRAGTAAVMVSSARYPRLDPDRIAAFSPAVVTGLLRGRLGFTGLVVSDDLGAAGALSGVPVGDRAVRFVAAGGDLVLTVRSADAAPMAAALQARAQESPQFDQRLREAAEHVLVTKYRAGLLPCGGTA